MPKIEDTLDILRNWIKESGFSYGELKPKLVIHNSIVSDIFINRGDETIHLRKENQTNNREKTGSRF